jgi:hypothetical protein
MGGRLEAADTLRITVPLEDETGAAAGIMATDLRHPTAMVPLLAAKWEEG